ncbi:MAG: putative GntR-family transcriptional regulator [Pseudonocardiales bacterium]|nr:putative GntR-family transcriptional regulator [Jatrophihabitantaceae bacterium]MCW2603162.1 putative GntR-family transcriptional regulator [Pseudonocardiales bacterium]
MKSVLPDPDVPDRDVVSISMDQLVTQGELSGAAPSRIVVEELEHAVIRSTPVIRSLLQREDHTVVMVEQLARLDGQPLYLRVGYYPTSDDPEALMARIERSNGFRDRSVEQTFRAAFGVGYGSSETVLEAVKCEAHAAQLLDIQEGDSILLRQMIVRDVDGQPWSLSYTHYRSDRVALSTYA